MFGWQAPFWIISSTGLKNTLRIAWNLENSSFSGETIERNIFLFNFLRGLDRNRVMLTGPWFLDKSLIVLDKPSNLVKPSDLEFTKIGSGYTSLISLLLV